ncbi:MAG: hypothetical protein EOP49_06420 [Sphingobacteriales bacterium]|nr:MAG: hypothetical protein EOP49_06420 [Sphingobacteriales bacterium]
MKKVLCLMLSIVSMSASAQEDGRAYKSGDFRFDFSIPHFNSLSLNPGGEFREVASGFGGWGAGFEYSYQDRKFLAASCAYVNTYKFFVGIPYTAEYNKVLFSAYANLTDNVTLGSFTLGYGFCYTLNLWQEYTRDLNAINLPTTYSRTYTSNNLGLSLNAWFRAGRSLHFGLIYQPSLLNLNNGISTVYEHSISAGVLWRFKLLNFNAPRQHRIRRI